MAMLIAKTEKGTVSGISRQDADFTEFRGIPYAKPPVGKLRFAPPEENEPWDGIRPCETWPKIAPQHFFDPKSELYPWGTAPMGEDCLYLNVYTPAESPEEKLPVYVWYHDGGLTNGWAFDPRNDPREIVKAGIVVVTVGHRLGQFGYMALPQLTKEQGRSGNYGVMDTVMALQWVNRNIRNFGGDPSNVTIAAESGGTTKCAALVATPALRGMIRRVICQSGLAWQYTPLNLEEAEEQGKRYLIHCGLDPDLSLEELRSLPYEALHVPMDPHDQPGKLIADGVTVPMDFASAFMEGSKGVDMLNCVCSGEAMTGAAPFTDAASFRAYYREILGDLYDRYGFEHLVQVTDENAQHLALELAALGLAPNVRSNYCRSLMIDRIFAHLAAKQSPENRYFTMRFSQVMPPRSDMPSAPLTLAPHGSDLWYSFGMVERGIPVSRPWRGEDRRVSRLFIGYLTNFVRTGDPNGEWLPFWGSGNEAFRWLDLCAEPSCRSGLGSGLDALTAAYACRTYGLDGSAFLDLT